MNVSSGTEMLSLAARNYTLDVPDFSIRISCAACRAAGVEAPSGIVYNLLDAHAFVRIHEQAYHPVARPMCGDCGHHLRAHRIVPFPPQRKCAALGCDCLTPLNKGD